MARKHVTLNRELYPSHPLKEVASACTSLVQSSGSGDKDEDKLGQLHHGKVLLPPEVRAERLDGGQCIVTVYMRVSISPDTSNNDVIHMMMCTNEFTAADNVDCPPGAHRTPIHQRLNMVLW